MNWFDRELEVKNRERELLRALALRRLTAAGEQPNGDGRLHGLWQAALARVLRRSVLMPAPAPKPVFVPVVLPAGHPPVDDSPCPTGCEGDAA